MVCFWNLWFFWTFSLKSLLSTPSLYQNSSADFFVRCLDHLPLCMACLEDCILASMSDDKVRCQNGIGEIIGSWQWRDYWISTTKRAFFQSPEDPCTLGLSRRSLLTTPAVVTSWSAWIKFAILANKPWAPVVTYRSRSQGCVLSSHTQHSNQHLLIARKQVARLRSSTVCHCALVILQI